MAPEPFCRLSMEDRERLFWRVKKETTRRLGEEVVQERSGGQGPSRRPRVITREQRAQRLGTGTETEQTQVRILVGNLLHWHCFCRSTHRHSHSHNPLHVRRWIGNSFPIHLLTWSRLRLRLCRVRTSSSLLLLPLLLPSHPVNTSIRFPLPPSP